MVERPGLQVVWNRGEWDVAQLGDVSHSPNGNGHGRPLRKLAIAGGHPNGRELIPWDDESYEIWTFNEAPQKPWCKRWDAVFQIHRPEVYMSPDNFVQKDHWQWLQEKRGKPIWMYPADARVPDAVEYPLEGVLSLIPYRYLRSSPAEALALAIYQGYTSIWLYGCELTSNTEYSYQAINMGFWIGFAHGRGIDFNLMCWQSEFNQRLYGIDGDTQIEREYFESRVTEMEPIVAENQKAVERSRSRLNDAMLDNKYDDVARLLVQCHDMAQLAGESAGVLVEAQKYANRTTHTPRQEYERTSAQAGIDAEDLKEKMIKESGKSEYVWNVWKMHGNMQALQQLRIFIDAQLDYAFQMGSRLGAKRENYAYMVEYDARVTAAGGVRALAAAGRSG